MVVSAFGREGNGGDLGNTGQIVGGARGGGIKVDRITGARMQAVGNVVALARVIAAARSEGTGDGQVGAHQGDVLAAGGELEVGVQVAIGVENGVIRSVDNQESTAGHDGPGRKGPLGEIAGVVGEVPAAEVDRTRPRIEDLDPVLTGAGNLIRDRIPRVRIVGRATVIGGHELVDDHLANYLSRETEGGPGPGRPGGVLGPGAEIIGGGWAQIAEEGREIAAINTDAQGVVPVPNRGASVVVAVVDRDLRRVVSGGGNLAIHLRCGGSDIRGYAIGDRWRRKREGGEASAGGRPGGGAGVLGEGAVIVGRVVGEVVGAGGEGSGLGTDVHRVIPRSRTRATVVVAVVDRDVWILSARGRNGAIEIGEGETDVTGGGIDDARCIRWRHRGEARRRVSPIIARAVARKTAEVIGGGTRQAADACGEGAILVDKGDGVVPGTGVGASVVVAPVESNVRVLVAGIGDLAADGGGGGLDVAGAGVDDRGRSDGYGGSGKELCRDNDRAC
ncbi:MAG: hypothetical protein QNL39_10130 [Akkermansiaceae bacterium]